MKKLIRKKAVVPVTVTLIAVVAILTVTIVNALWDESKAVRIKASEIENSTLVIGTHLIHLSALSEPLYDIAKDSSYASGQENVYYKSELASGVWRDITAANDISAIAEGFSSESASVADTVIEALFFTHHTKSDGVTYDLRTGKAVNIFDIYDPYDLEALEELMPLKLQYDLYQETQKDSDDGKKKIARIAEFFATEVENEVTNKCDDDLTALQNYYEAISSSEKGAESSEINAVQSVMDSVDATRRANVFETLEKALLIYAEELQTAVDTPETPEETDADGNVIVEARPAMKATQPDAILIAAVNESLANVQDALILYQGKMLSEGESVASLTYYGFANELIESPNDNAVKNIVNLNRILNDEIINRDEELTMLSDILIPKATERYTSAISAGETAEYGALKSTGAADALLNSVATASAGVADGYRSELEFFIKAYTDRFIAEEAYGFVNERLGLTTTWFSRVKDDEFKFYLDNSLESHVEFLSKLLRLLEQKTGGSDLDKLQAEKIKLQEEYMSALDKNDLVKAKETEELIALKDEEILAEENEVDNKIADLQSRLSELRAEDLNDGDNKNEEKIRSLETQLSVLNNSLSDNSVGKLIADLRKEAIDLIKDGDSDLGDLGDNLDALSGMLDLNYKTAFPALKDVYDEALKQKERTNSSAFDSLIDKIEAAVLENRAAYETAMLAEVDFENLANSYFGDLSGDNAVVYIMALNSYYEQTGSLKALELAKFKTFNEYDLNNSLIFLKCNDPLNVYIPAKSISKVLNFGYVWNRNSSKATLTKGTNYYSFTAYSNRVFRDKSGSKTEEMALSAKFRADVYIPNFYTIETFGLDGVYIPETEYGVVVREEFIETANALLEAFLRGY